MHSLLPKSRLGSVDATSNIWYEVPIFTLGVFMAEKKLIEIEEELKYLRQRIDANDEADRKERFELSQTIKNLDVSRLREKIETNGEEDRKSYNIVGNRLDRIEKRIDGLIENLKSNFETDHKLSEELKLVEKTLKDLKSRTAKILLGALAFALPIIGFILLGNFTRFSVNDKHIIDSIESLALESESDTEKKLKFSEKYAGWIRPEKANMNDLTNMTKQLKFETSANPEAIDEATLEQIIVNLPNYVAEELTKPHNKIVLQNLTTSKNFNAAIIERYRKNKDYLIDNFAISPYAKNNKDFDDTKFYDTVRAFNTSEFPVILVPAAKEDFGNAPGCINKKLETIDDAVEIIIPKKLKDTLYKDTIIQFLDCGKYQGTSAHIELTLKGEKIGEFKVSGFYTSANIDRLRVVFPPQVVKKTTV